MKKTRKVISIILSAFMLMQMMTGVVFASSLAPSNLRWITGRDLGWNNDDKGLIAWDIVDGYDLYIIYIYKDNVQISNCLTERDEDYDFGYESVWGDIKSGGTGNYTVKVATYGGNWDDFDKYENDEDIPVLGVSEMSEPFTYVGDAATSKQESNNTEPAITAESSDNTAFATQTESKTAVSATGEIECPSAVKVCYDLGIMPDVYENANKIVTYDEFNKIVANLLGDSRTIESTNENITLGHALDVLCEITLRTSSNEEIIFYSGMKKNIEIDNSANITYAQLAKVIYNALIYTKIRIGEGGYVRDLRGEWVRETEKKVTGGLLYNKGYVKYIGDVAVSGDTATVSGKLYNQENKSGKSVENVKLSISDKDLKSGDDYLLFVKDDAIISAVSANGAKTETVSKDITPPTVITLTIGDVNATVNGKSVSNDVAPKIVNDRTMLPIRFVAEALGAEVGWNEYSQSVSINWPTKVYISIKIGSNYASVAENRRPEEQVKLDSPAFVENDRTYLPLRFIAEKLGADVQWDDATQTITITKQ